MNAELLVLRAIHIYGAVVWAGTSLFVAFFLIPAIGAAGPAGGPVMGALIPAIGRMMALGQLIAAAPEAERGALMEQLNAIRARATTASKVAALFISITIVAMALGRYV